MALRQMKRARYPWGRTRTLRTLESCRLVEVTLQSNSGYTLTQEPAHWVYLTVLSGALTVAINGGTVRTVEPGNRMGVSPGSSMEVHNRLERPCMFTLLLVAVQPMDQDVA